MRLNIIILAVTVLLGIGLTLWFDNSSGSIPNSPLPVIELEEVNQESVPPFSFQTLDGKNYSISDFKGKTILINFWATWCAPCVVEFPKLIALAKQNPDIVIIGLSSDIDDAKIIRFLDKNPDNLPNFLISRDQKRKITADVFQTYKLPETVIISPSGKIVKKILGDTDWGGQEMTNFLSSLNSF